MKAMILNTINEIRDESGRARLDLANLPPNPDLRSDIGFDSLDLAVLTVRLESATGVDIFQDGVVTTVEEIAIKLAAAQKSKSTP